jgi:hypothetical protein
VNSFDSKIPTRKISFDEELLYNWFLNVEN